MTDEEFTTRIEPIDPWMPISCYSCGKPAVQQETAFWRDKRLPVSKGNCGDPDCANIAAAEVLRLSAIPGVTALAI